MRLRRPPPLRNSAQDQIHTEFISPETPLPERFTALKMIRQAMKMIRADDEPNSIAQQLLATYIPKVERMNHSLTFGATTAVLVALVGCSRGPPDSSGLAPRQACEIIVNKAVACNKDAGTETKDEQRELMLKCLDYSVNEREKFSFLTDDFCLRVESSKAPNPQQEAVCSALVDHEKTCFCTAKAKYPEITERSRRKACLIATDTERTSMLSQLDEFCGKLAADTLFRQEVRRNANDLLSKQDGHPAKVRACLANAAAAFVKKSMSFEQLKKEELSCTAPQAPKVAACPGHDIERAYVAPDEARMAFKKSLSSSEADAHVYIAVGKVLLEEGRLEEAEIAYSSALSTSEQRASALAGLGDVALARDDARLARTQYEAALNLQPTLASARAELGHILFKSGDVAEDEIARQHRMLAANAEFERAISDQPCLARAWFYLAFTQYGLGKKNRVEQSLRKAIECQPDLAEAHLQLGRFLVGAGRKREAEEAFNAAIVARDGDFEQASRELSDLR